VDQDKVNQQAAITGIVTSVVDCIWAIVTKINK
jgi:hypothetical protein